MESNALLAAWLDVAVPPAKGKQLQLTLEKPSERLLTIHKIDPLFSPRIEGWF